MKVAGNGTGMEMVGLSEERLAEMAKQPECRCENSKSFVAKAL